MNMNDTKLCNFGQQVFMNPVNFSLIKNIIELIFLLYTTVMKKNSLYLVSFIFNHDLLFIELVFLRVSIVIKSYSENCKGMYKTFTKALTVGSPKQAQHGHYNHEKTDKAWTTKTGTYVVIRSIH